MAIEEQTDQIQTTLFEILSRFDVQAEKLDRLSTAMKNLGQQVEIQQDSIDEVKRSQSEFLRQPPAPPPPSPPPPLQPPALNRPSGAGLVTMVIPLGALANHRPPLLPQPHGAQSSYDVVTMPVSPAETWG